jgi:hypothetical protein
MGASSAPPFNGISGQEAPDPVAGKPGHFAWSRWIKSYIKAVDRDAVKQSGDTMTGRLIIPPTSSSDPAHTAASKSYVDSTVQVALPATGGTLTGPLVLPATKPTDPANVAVTKGYVDGSSDSHRRTWADFPA